MLKKMSCLILCFLLLISDSSILAMATDESQLLGWVYENEHWYLYDSDGVMQTGWHKVGGNTYHLSETGEMTFGWLYEENSWYNVRQRNVYEKWLRIYC